MTSLALMTAVIGNTPFVDFVAAMLIKLDPQLTNRQLALHGKESGGKNSFGREHSPEEDSEISQDFTSTFQCSAEIPEKVSYRMHCSKIPDLLAVSNRM
jgi:hypothetical protein